MYKRQGEICVKGPNVMLGYYKDEEATKAVFDEDGFFRTGDYGKLDEDGWIYITGRLKNLIIFSNGKNVYPEEIETELSRIFGVSEAVVYAGESKSNPQKEMCIRDRNKSVGYVCNDIEPVLRLIAFAAKGAHRHGIWIGVCGELAADTSLTERFIEMGIDELSVAAPYILTLREKIRRCV